MCFTYVYPPPLPQYHEYSEEQNKVVQAPVVSYLESKEMFLVHISEHELWPLVRVGQELGHPVPQPTEGAVPRVPAENGQSKVKL